MYANAKDYNPDATRKHARERVTPEREHHGAEHGYDESKAPDNGNGGQLSYKQRKQHERDGDANRTEVQERLCYRVEPVTGDTSLVIPQRIDDFDELLAGEGTLSNGHKKPGITFALVWISPVP